MDLSKLTANEMMAWGLANLQNEGREGGYSIWHGCCPVNDFGRPWQEVSNPNNATINLDKLNFFEKAYPTLFPYGCGGIEANQESPMRFGDHIKWALWYFDHCFHKHEMFPFVAFGISQRCTPSGLHEYRCAIKTLSMMITLWLKLLWSSSSRHRGRKSKVFQFLTLPLGYSKAMSMPPWGVSWAQISLVFKWEARSGPHRSTWGHHTFG